MVLFYPDQAREIDLPSSFMNETVVNGFNIEQVQSSNEEGEIEVTNKIIGIEMGRRPKESFEDNSIAFSVQGFRDANSLPGSVYPTHDTPVNSIADSYNGYIDIPFER